MWSRWETANTGGRNWGTLVSGAVLKATNTATLRPHAKALVEKLPDFNVVLKRNATNTFDKWSSEDQPLNGRRLSRL